MISEDKLHAVAVCSLHSAAAEELNFPFTPISWISIGILNGVDDMQRILFLLYLPTCMFYTLIPSPNPYVVVVVSHLLATKITHGPWMKAFGAEMKNPVILLTAVRPPSVSTPYVLF